MIHTRIAEEPAGFLNRVTAFSGAVRMESTLFYSLTIETAATRRRCWNQRIQFESYHAFLPFDLIFYFLGSVRYFMGRNEKCGICYARKDPSCHRNRENRVLLFLFWFFLEGFTPQPVSD